VKHVPAHCISESETRGGSN